MLALFGDFTVSLARALYGAAVVLIMGLICGVAVLFTLVFAAPLQRLRPEPVRAGTRNTRALLNARR